MPEPDPPTSPPSDDDSLTLAEVAELLGVHYMTAYRYVRIGKLPARRDGRVWRVDRDQVDALVAAADRPTVAEPENAADERARLLAERLVAFDERGAWAVVEGALVSGVEPVGVHVDIVGPAMRELGERSATGRLEMANEQAATTICRHLVGRLSLTSSRPGLSKGTVVFVVAPGDHHVMPATMAADIFRASGFDVIDCGARLPVEAVAILVEQVERLAAVGISATMPAQRWAVRYMADAIRRRRPEATILVGGAGADALGEAQTAGVDHVATSAVDGVAYLTDR